MKKLTYILTSLMLLLTSCDDKLDIVPTGKTTLSSLDDLETLLEWNWNFNATLPQETLCGNSYPTANPMLSSLLAVKTTANYAYLTGDESVDRTVDNDYSYRMMYQHINYMNIVISKAPGATGGSSHDRKRIISEAHILRAWFHFLLVNLYAKQYDEKTAAELGGIAFVEDTNPQQLKRKLTVKEVYDKILEDCSEEHIANVRQEHVKTPFRFGADFANGVRAMVLMQMKRYSEAKEYALKAISINHTLEDRTTALDNGSWVLPYDSDNNYLTAYIIGIGMWNNYVCAPGLAALIRPNDALLMLGQQKGTDGWVAASNKVPAGCYISKSRKVNFNSYGLRTENMYFLLAEVLFREGKFNDGFKYLDDIRNRRLIDNDIQYANSGQTFTEKTAMDILQAEKRVEMFSTIYNFLDRKRWNTETDYRKTMVVDCGDNGKFNIEPDSKLWVLPFPTKATKYNETLTNNF